MFRCCFAAHVVGILTAHDHHVFHFNQSALGLRPTRILQASIYKNRDKMKLSENALN